MPCRHIRCNDSRPARGPRRAKICQLAPTLLAACRDAPLAGARKQICCSLRELNLLSSVSVAMIGRTACVTGAFLLPWLTAVPLASAADDAQTTGVAAASTRGGSVQCERAGSGVRCLITSQRGIGHATLKRQGKAWPAPLVLRLQLRGLESL